MDHDEDELENAHSLLDLPEKTTSLAKLVHKSRSKSSKDDILVKKDNNTLNSNQQISNNIGYWDTQLRPLEYSFSQMNVVASLKLASEASSKKDNDGKEGKKKEDEKDKIIFSLRLYDNGMMSFNPDVTTVKNVPHTFQFNGNTWKLWIENVAEPLNILDEDKEEKIYTEFYSRQASNLSLKTLNFEDAPLFSLKLCLFGEIVSATGFEDFPLYLKYEIKLPEHWEIELGDCCDSLSGTTISSIPRNNTYHWSHPIDLNLICKDTLSPPSWPLLNVVIYSYDFWNRHRIQGYATIPFPRTSGCHNVTMQTWKPVEDRENSLSNYFLGGSRIVDLSLVQTSERINRYGFYTETSGSLTVKWNVIFTSESYSTKSDEGDLGSVNLAVLSTALSRAKARLKALRTSEESII